MDTTNKILPEIGKTYNCFDDDKIRKSRLYQVKVKEIIPFDKIDEKTKKLWQKEVEECYWLYAKETDYFIITDNGIFVRTKNRDWFSINGFLGSGLLDVE